MSQTPTIAPRSPVESGIARKIAARVKDRKTSFVFPTQASANSWAKVAIDLPGISSVEKDRFLGWDRFIERVTKSAVPAGKIKSEADARLFWALRVLRDQAERPFLRRLAKPGFSPSLSLSASLARIAPALRDIMAALRGADRLFRTLGQEEELADYAALAASYAAFLDENGLYEERHLEPGKAIEESFVVFWPSLIPGYDKYSGPLKRACSVEEYPVRGGESLTGTPAEILVHTYKTFSQELQSVFSACGTLLDSGLEPEKIAISAPVLTPEFQAHMKRVADRHGLPLTFHSGLPLSASPFGNLLLSLSRAEEEGFSLRTLRKLLDLGPFRWKDAESARRLIRIAESCHIPEFSADKRSMAALWNKTFGLCPKADKGLRDFYSALKEAAYSISGAASFPALGRAVFDFRDALLDESTLPAEAEMTLERIIDELQSLDTLGARLCASDMPASPFRILLLSLDSETYNPSESANAISVYPYHVGMLVASDIHFVLDASQESARPALARFSGLPEEFRSLVGDSSDVLSALFESFNVVNAVYCHAERGLSGYSVLHPYFRRAGATIRPIDARDIPRSPEALETLAWLQARAELLPPVLPKAKREAALGIFLSERGGGTGFAGEPAPSAAQPFPPPFLVAAASPRPVKKALDASLLQRLPSCSADPLVKITPSRLRNFVLCPFKWLLSCVPNVDKGPSAVADLAEGSLTHALIRALLTEIAGPGEAVVPARLEESMLLLDRLLPRCLDAIMRQTGPSVEIAMLSAYPKIRDRLARLLAFETGFRSEGWNIGEFERNLSKSYEALGLLVEGRADRVVSRPSSGSPGGADGRLYAIIDYKKKTTPRKKDFLVGEDGKLRDYQIAGYAEMLREEGKNVELAFYWSIENCEPSTVFGQGGARADWDDFGLERSAFAAAIESTARAIREGSFMAITPSIEGCASCPTRPVCRAHFSSERT